mmetsp:Transcript_25756/g.71768  ORF Transcript_25756/g.71768 Transcript_25756/m.71768 type:complete len:130 (-) Transcript_25756:119-508(-)
MAFQRSSTCAFILLTTALHVLPLAAEPPAPLSGVPSARPKRALGKDHVMMSLQASMQRGRQELKVTKTKPPPQTQAEKDEACSRFMDDEAGVCPGSVLPGSSYATQGTSRLQTATVVKKVVLDLEEDED